MDIIKELRKDPLIRCETYDQRGARIKELEEEVQLGARVIERKDNEISRLEEQLHNTADLIEACMNDEFKQKATEYWKAWARRYD